MSTGKRSSDKAGRGALESLGRPSVARRSSTCSFGRPSPPGDLARRLRFLSASPRQSGSDGSETQVVCPLLSFHPPRSRPPGDTCPSPNAKRSRSYGRKATACARLRAGPGRRLRSSGSCAAMRPRAAAPSSTERLRRSGTPTGPPRRPKPAKLATNAQLRRYVQDRLGGVIAAPSDRGSDQGASPWT